MTKDSGDCNESPPDVQSNSARKVSTSSSYKRKKMMERVTDDPDDSLSGEETVCQTHKEVNNTDKTDTAPTTPNVPTCSTHNLEKLREKRKERKKTLLKLQYESGKLDDIHKWMSGASNSED
ncbi:hypothetical protein WDU94_000751 [Cyamophila willieti]